VKNEVDGGKRILKYRQYAAYYMKVRECQRSLQEATNFRMGGVIKFTVFEKMIAKIWQKLEDGPSYIPLMKCIWSGICDVNTGTNIITNYLAY
jgi:hypothetical protein